MQHIVITQYNSNNKIQIYKILFYNMYIKTRKNAVLERIFNETLLLTA